MRRFVFRPRHSHDFRITDAERIVKVLRENGISLSLNDAIMAWETYSDVLCAKPFTLVQWLFLPEDDDTLFRVVMDYIQEESE